MLPISSNTSSHDQLTSSGDCDQVQEQQSEFSKAEPSKEGKAKGVKRKTAAVSEVPILIDNKHKQLEKRLTSPQRYQKLLEAAKEDTLMKEMMDYFKESSRSTAHAIENMSQTMNKLAQGLTQGITLLAGALVRQPQQVFVPQYQANYSEQPRLAAQQSQNYNQQISVQSAATSCTIYGATSHDVSDNHSGSYIQLLRQ